MHGNCCVGTVDFQNDSEVYGIIFYFSRVFSLSV